MKCKNCGHEKKKHYINESFMPCRNPCHCKQFIPSELNAKELIERAVDRAFGKENKGCGNEFRLNLDENGICGSYYYGETRYCPSCSRKGYCEN